MKKIIMILGFFVITIIFSPISRAISPNGSADYSGVDIYHGTSQVDWAALAQQKKFVYIKASEGEHTTDSKFTSNVFGAQSVGMKWGAYHFFHVYGEKSAVLQAQHFYNVIKNDTFECIPAVDVEMTDSQDAPEIQADLRVFIDEFSRLAGYKPMIYTYTSFANEFIGNGFTDCKLWIAHYGVSAPGNVKGWTAWDAWQYSENGGVAAIANDKVDLDTATANIFLHSGAVPDTAVVNADSLNVYPVNFLPYAVNATAGTDFNVRNSDGYVVSGREVSKGDPMILLSVDYNRQLAEVLYPNYTAGQWIHGYIKNLQDRIHNIGYNKWRNGTTNEAVYDSSGNRIGTIYPYEKATKLYKQNGKTAVLYTTSKGTETKSGLVTYTGL